MQFEHPLPSNLRSEFQHIFNTYKGTEENMEHIEVRYNFFFSNQNEASS